MNRIEKFVNTPRDDEQIKNITTNYTNWTNLTNETTD